MKLSLSVLLLFSVVACTYATWMPYPTQKPLIFQGQGFPKPLNIPIRFRREASPQNSITIEGSKPIGGPDHKPTVNFDYNRRLIDGNNGHLDAYGGGGWTPGRAINPHAGFKFEKNYNNGFIGGFGQVQPGPRGHPDPSFGIRGGFRF